MCGQMIQQALPSSPAPSGQIKKRTAQDIHNELTQTVSIREKLEKSQSSFLRSYLGTEENLKLKNEKRVQLEADLAAAIEPTPDAYRIRTQQLQELKTIKKDIISMRALQNMSLFSCWGDREQEVIDWQTKHGALNKKIVTLQEKVKHLAQSQRQADESDDEQLEGAGQPGGPQKK